MSALADEIAARSRSAVNANAARDFGLYAKTFLMGRGRPAEMQKLGARLTSHRLQEVLKTAVSTGTVASPTWAGPAAPYQNMVEGFVGTLAPYSAFDTMYPAMTHLPLRTRTVIASTGATGYVDSPLGSTPISALNFAGGTLEAQRVEAAIVISDELANFMGSVATDKITEELRIAVAKRTDLLFASVLTSSTGIPSNSSTGLTASALMADLSTALSAMSIGVESKLFAVVPANRFAKISLLRDTGGALVVNGKIGDLLTITPSSAITGQIIVVDAVQIAAANDTITFVPAEQASVAETDVSTAGTQSTVSLWQNKLLGLKVNRWFGCELLNATGAALITSVA